MNYTIDGQPASPDSFYAVACDPARSVVVEACAGAGKTWMLVSRIVRALLDGCAPKQILAITFTRKAAGEMQQRLHDWLREWAGADAATCTQALVERGMTPAAAQAAAPRLAALWGELLGGEGVAIRTFHAWFGQLLHMAPLAVLDDLGLHPGMTLLDEPAELQAPLMRRFAAAVLADPGLAADHLALGQRLGRHTLDAWLQAAWQRRMEVARADAAGHLLNAVAPAATDWHHPLDGWPALEPLLRETACVLGAAKGIKSQDAAAGLLNALAMTDPRAAWAAARQALFTGKGEPLKLSKNPLPEFEAACAALDALTAALTQQDAHDDHQRMTRLARALLQTYAQLKRERGVVDMNDLESLAATLLADSQWAPWLQERLDARYAHVLLDEFQDTSPLQWQALAPWLAGYAGAGAGTPFAVFIVGDPKQSIYRFRRAEPRVFTAAQDFVTQALGGQRLSANHTRRNTPAVLDAVNTVFAQAQAAGHYAGFAPHTSGAATDTTPLAGLYALPLVQRPDKPEADEPPPWRDSLTQPQASVQEPLLVAEARRVAAAVAALVRPGDGRAPTPPGSIYVLARRRRALAEISRALQAQQVPHVQAAQVALIDVCEVRDMLALLDVLASPGHDVALAHVLKSPLFGASDADLMTLAAAGSTTWFAALPGQSSPPLARAARWLPAWVALAQRWPPHDVLDHILHEADALPRLLAACAPTDRAQAQAALTALVEQTLALDGGRYLSLYAFVRALKTRLHQVPAAPDAHAVQLLTVHTAKGLEADIVFLADAFPNARGGTQSDLLVDWPVTATHPVRAAFVASAKALAPSLQTLAADEAALDAREDLNLLYVALTRARRAVVVSAAQPHRRASSDPLWWERLAPHAQPWPELWQAATAPATAQEPVHAPDWRACTPPPAEPLNAPPPDELSRTGEAFHRLLQWRRTDDAAAVQVASAFQLAPSACAHAQTAAQRVLASPALAALMQDADEVADEVPINWQGQSLRIDRLLRRGHDWWVLDYKLHHAPQHDPALRAQLTTYRAAVQALEPTATVHAAFVTGQGEVIELARDG